MRFHALLVRAPDLAAAEDFYAGRMGLEPARLSHSLTRLSAPGGALLYVERVAPAPAPAPDQARAFATVLVPDIEAIDFNDDEIDPLTRTPKRVRGGLCVRVRDPFGNVQSLIEPRERGALRAPMLSSAGIKIPIASIPAARRLYADTLGFVPQNERYYPPLLPMGHRDGSLAFTIEDKEIWEPDMRVRAPLYPNETGAVLIFQTDNLAALAAPSLRLTPTQDFTLGHRRALIDPAGLASEVWQL